MKQYRILFVERQHAVEQELLPTLAQHYEIALAHGRKEAVMAVETQMPDLVLLDVPSVRFDTTRFCEDLKQRWPSLPLFFLLGKGMRLDKFPRAHGFLRHPFTLRQLLHRLSRVLPECNGVVVAWRGLQLDVAGYSLTWATETTFLTPKQAALALAFLRAPEKTLSRAVLMQEVWGTDYLGDTRTLDVHIHWLRNALKSMGAPFQLKTQRSEGYRLLSLKAKKGTSPEITTES